MISWKSTGTYIPKHEFSSTSMISKYPVIGLLLRFIASFCNGFTNIDHKTIFVHDLFVRNCLSLVHLICKNCRDFASIPSCYTFAPLKVNNTTWWRWPSGLGASLWSLSTWVRVPSVTRIQRGDAVVADEAHILLVAGSIPAPATIHCSMV